MGIDIDKVANLARIKLTDKEKKSLSRDLSSILDYVDKLNQVESDKVEPLYQTTGLANAVRSDKTREEFMSPDSLKKYLIEQAPDHQDRLIKVKAILKK